VLDLEYMIGIATSPVICTINIRPYWDEVLEILADEDIWVDYIVSGISISPTPYDEGVVEHTLICYMEDGWEGYAIVNHVIDKDKISSSLGPWHILDDIKVLDEQEYCALMEKREAVRNKRLVEYEKSREAGIPDKYSSQDASYDEY